MSEKHPKKGHGHKKLEPHERRKHSAEARRRLLPLLKDAKTVEDVIKLRPELIQAGLRKEATLKINQLKGVETKIKTTAKEGVSKIAKENPEKAEEVEKETEKITKTAEEEVETAEKEITLVILEEENKKTPENTETKKLSIEDQIAELMIDMPEKDIEKLNENEEFFKYQLAEPKNAGVVAEEATNQLENIEKIKALQKELLDKSNIEIQKEKEKAQEALVLKTQKEFFDAQKNKPKKPGFFNFSKEAKIKYQTDLEKWEKNLKEKGDIYTSTKNERVRNLLEKGERAAAQEFLLAQLELKKQNDLENSSTPEKIKNGISKSIKWWEEIGKNPDDSKTKQFLKKTAKTIASVAIIGGASAAIVSSAAAVGVGSAGALAGGMGAYLTRRIAISVGFSTAINLTPDKYKPIAALAGTGLSMLSMAGIAGYSVSKLSSFATKKWWSEEAIAKKSGETMESLGNKKINLDTLDADIKKMEEDIAKVSKEAEKKRTYRRLLATATALAAGVAVLEISGHISDENKAEEAAKQEEQRQEQEKAEEKLKAEEDKKLEEQEKKEATEKENTKNKETTESKTVDQDAVVHKGEGIEHALQRQGLSGHEAHLLAIKMGYVDGDGNEVRVAVADKVAYVVHNENGNLSVEEKYLNDNGMWESKETHHEGDKFETNTEKYEYSHDGNGEQTNNANENTENNLDNHKIIPPEHVNPNENNTDNQAIIAPEHVNGTENNLTDEKIVAPEHVNKTSGTENSEEEANSENNNNINEFNLTPEQLDKVDKVYEDNAKQLFGEDSLKWKQLERGPAENFVRMNTGEFEDPQAIKFLEHIQHLQEITELHPIEEDALREAETVGEFIKRTEQFLESKGQLDKAKL